MSQDYGASIVCANAPAQGEDRSHLRRREWVAVARPAFSERKSPVAENEPAHSAETTPDDPQEDESVSPLVAKEPWYWRYLGPATQVAAFLLFLVTLICLIPEGVSWIVLVLFGVVFFVIAGLASLIFSALRGKEEVRRRSRRRSLDPTEKAANVLLWSLLGTFLVLLFATTSSVVFGWPLDLRSYLLPQKVQPVFFRLKHQDILLKSNFDAVVRPPQMDPIPKVGMEGELVLQLPVPSGSEIQIDVTCAGYVQKESRRYIVPANRVIEIAMEKATLPPALPGQFPADAAIPDLPSREEAQSNPKVAPNEVTFRYKNRTNQNRNWLARTAA